MLMQQPSFYYTYIIDQYADILGQILIQKFFKLLDSLYRSKFSKIVTYHYSLDFELISDLLGNFVHFFLATRH